jgi:hypothetical protein
MIAFDPETGELVGSAGAVQALLAGEEDVDDDAVAAALEAARDPAFRLWTEGFEPDGAQALLPTTTAQLPVALAAWLNLGPRPRPDHPPVRLPPGPMAILIGRGEAHGHDLDPALAKRLQERLDAGVRHWTVRVQRGEWRRNLEVVEGEAGIWRVRPAGELVELAPTSTTAVVRELIALLNRSASRSAAP